MFPHFKPETRGGFTVVELLVSAAVVAMLLIVLVSMTDSTRRTWSYTSGKLEQFREARLAFESITRRLSQATLNAYWDYDNPALPTKYVRQSELRFVSGRADEIVSAALPPSFGAPESLVSHACFFQAPLGYSEVGGTPNGTDFSGLENVLNTWGYFIHYGDDANLVPNPLQARVPARTRFRLYELMEPSEQLSIYKYTSGNSSYNDRTWFTNRITAGYTRVVAENIIALVLIPKLSSSDLAAGGYTAASLAPEYLYDSTGRDMPTLTDKNLNPKNQLPPILNITLVAVDEASFARKHPTPAELNLNGYFDKVGDTTDPGAAGYARDLKDLQDQLLSKQLSYRVFSSDVSIKAAKWSREQ